MAVYNGRLVRNPKPIGKGQVLVSVPPNKKEIEQGHASHFQLEISQKFLLKVLDREQIERSKQSHLQRHANGGFKLIIGAGLRHKFVALMAQIRAACKMAQKEYAEENKINGVTGDVNGLGALRTIFSQFDVDRSGTIAKSEFLVSCLSMGVAVTETEVEMLWPLLDNDNSGDLDIEEFIKSIDRTDKSKNREGFMRVRDEQHGHCIKMGEVIRDGRIKMKSTLSQTLTSAVLNLRQAVQAYMKHRNKTAEEIFYHLDKVVPFVYQMFSALDVNK
jgi:hypothetical protein